MMFSQNMAATVINGFIIIINLSDCLLHLGRHFLDAAVETVGLRLTSMNKPAFCESNESYPLSQGYIWAKER